MKLNNVLLNAVLFAYGLIDGEVNKCYKSIENLKCISIESFADDNISGFGNKIDVWSARIGNYKLLKILLSLGVYSLDDRYKQLITEYYFNRTPVNDVCQHLGIDYNAFRYVKRKALEQINNKIYVLGLTSDWLIDNFDDDSFLVSLCVRVVKDKIAGVKHAKKKDKQ